MPDVFEGTCQLRSHHARDGTEQQPAGSRTDAGRSPGGCWPTREQEWLLQAIVLPRAAALTAWTHWRAAVDFETLDMGSQRLIPQLCQRLLRGTATLMGRIKGMYRRTWAQNQLLLQRLQAVLRSLEAAGVETLVLKGAALIVQHYREPGLRPMDDADVLVRPDTVERAITILRREAWQPMNSVSRGRLRAFHAMGFRHVDGQRLDLHWHVLPESSEPHADDEFWRAARPGQLGGVAMQTMHPTDNLFHVCAHGVRWNVIPPLRWVADAAAIMTTAPDEIDWDRLADVAARHHLVLPMRQSLRYLRILLHPALPPVCIERLERLSVSAAERCEYRLRIAPPSRFFGNVPLYWFDWLRACDARGWSSRSLGFPGYVRDRWGCETWTDFARQVMTRSTRRVQALAAARRLTDA